jgi:hypothetical protein
MKLGLNAIKLENQRLGKGNTKMRNEKMNENEMIKSIP